MAQHGMEERLADFGQSGLDASGFLIVRIGKRLGSVRFDVPFDIGPILVALIDSHNNESPAKSRAMKKGRERIYSHPRGVFNADHRFLLYSGCGATELR
jgi:hypothetical protein